MLIVNYLDGNNRLANRTELEPQSVQKARVCGVMVRTRGQTPAAFADAVRVDRWEVVLVEAEVRGVEGLP